MCVWVGNGSFWVLIVIFDEGASISALCEEVMLCGLEGTVLNFRDFIKESILGRINLYGSQIFYE